MKILKKSLFSITLLAAFCLLNETASAQAFTRASQRESARSDKLTGGTIERTALAPGADGLKITVNVPAFQLTLWQNGKEIKSYWVGVGLKDHPIYIGFREASDVIWNPNWIPPGSNWVAEMKTVKAGEVIKPTDPRNPLGKLKIPLGGGYLIHQAKGIGDLGGLVSHGCVRMMKNDLFDLAEKIVAARGLPLTRKQIENAKLTKKTLAAELDPPIPVEITYDTQVVEAGRLRVYPDVYDRETNTIENLRKELQTSGVDTSQITDLTLKTIIARAVAKKQFVVSVADIEAGRALRGGRVVPVVGQTAATIEKPASKTTKNTGSAVRRRRA